MVKNNYHLLQPELMLNTGPRQCQARRRSRQGGFTLTELSVVVFIIIVLVGLLSSALNTTKNKALKLNCLDNLKQLQFAWTMYVDDNNDYLPLNQTAPGSMHPRIPFKRNSTNSWVAGNPLEDVSTLNIQRGTLFPYLQNAAVYRCPMDESTVVNQPGVERTRSYSMNSYLAGDRAGSDPLVKSRFSELFAPQPESVFVFIEEHESSRWGSSFDLLPKNRLTGGVMNWISLPSDRHNQGANLSFADGHVEYWRWFSPKRVRIQAAQLTTKVKESSDLRKLQNAIPVR